MAAVKYCGSFLLRFEAAGHSIPLPWLEATPARTDHHSLRSSNLKSNPSDILLSKIFSSYSPNTHSSLLPPLPCGERNHGSNIIVDPHSYPFNLPYDNCVLLLDQPSGHRGSELGLHSRRGDENCTSRLGHLSCTVRVYGAQN